EERRVCGATLQVRKERGIYVCGSRVTVRAGACQIARARAGGLENARVAAVGLVVTPGVEAEIVRDGDQQAIREGQRRRIIGAAYKILGDVNGPILSAVGHRGALPEECVEHIVKEEVAAIDGGVRLP